MKKQFVSMALVCAMVLFGAGMSLAGQGNGVGGGTGPIHDIFSGVPFTFEGEVTGCAQGGGLTLDTEEYGEVMLYGIGPVYYWKSLDVGHPAMGDTLTAIGNTVDYIGTYRNVVTSIIIGETTVVLRDPETGKPLWRGTNAFSAGPGSTGGSRNSGNVGGKAGSGGSGGSATSGG